MALSTYQYPSGQRIGLHQYVADVVADDVAGRTCSRKIEIGPKQCQRGVEEWQRKSASSCLR